MDCARNAVILTRPVDHIHCFGCPVDDGSTQDSPKNIDPEEIDIVRVWRLRWMDRGSNILLPNYRAVGRVVRPDIVGHGTDIDNVMNLAIAHLDSGDIEGLSLEP